MSNFAIDYSGFEASTDMHFFIQQLVSNMEEISPSDSFLKVNLANRDGQYEGVLHISSINGKFLSSASGTSIVDVALRLFADARRKVEKWRATRFQLMNL